jgi:hypothetical protein
VHVESVLAENAKLALDAQATADQNAFFAQQVRVRIRALSRDWWLCSAADRDGLLDQPSSSAGPETSPPSQLKAPASWSAILDPQPSATSRGAPSVSPCGDAPLAATLPSCPVAWITTRFLHPRPFRIDLSLASLLAGERSRGRARGDRVMRRQGSRCAAVAPARAVARVKCVNGGAQGADT